MLTELSIRQVLDTHNKFFNDFEDQTPIRIDDANWAAKIRIERDCVMNDKNEGFQANGERELRSIKEEEVRESVHLRYREELEKAPFIRRYLLYLKIQFIIRKELSKKLKENSSDSAVYIKN